VGLAESLDCTEDEPHGGTCAPQPLVADHTPGNLALPDTGRPKWSFRCITMLRAASRPTEYEYEVPDIQIVLIWVPVNRLPTVVVEIALSSQ
jgi:hypothetical protein